jgi:hypothetical protein
VSHAEHDVRAPAPRCLLDDEVEHGHEDVVALEAEPLLTEVRLVQELLEPLGFADPAQEAPAIVRRQLGDMGGALDLVPQPIDLHMIVEVLEFVADRSSVDLAKLRECIGHGPLVGVVRDDQRGRKLPELFGGRAVKGRGQLRMPGRRATQRIDAREQVAVVAERLDECSGARDGRQQFEQGP